MSIIRPSADVRYGSKADMCSAQAHVRFTPDSDRESGFPRKVMSALPPTADMCGATRDVRFGPKVDIVPTRRLHPRGQAIWEALNTERSGDFGIDRHVKFCRLNNRQIRGLLAFEDAPRIDCGLTIGFWQISAIAHETASQNVLAPSIDCRNGVLRSGSYDFFALAVEKWFARNDKFGSLTFEPLER